MAVSWLVGDHAAAATERILDAAGRCFARQGVAATSVGDIAAAAGCSRPTIYRYFDDRDGLRAAFVEREADRIAHRISESVGAANDPVERLVTGISSALLEVRGDPTLMAWFDATQSGVTEEVAHASRAIARLIGPFVHGDDDVQTERRTDWVIRVVLSLLSSPGASAEEEQTMLREFLVPVVLDG